jgi:hypothetical protein
LVVLVFVARQISSWFCRGGLDSIVTPWLDSSGLVSRSRDCMSCLEVLFFILFHR